MSVSYTPFLSVFRIHRKCILWCISYVSGAFQIFIVLMEITSTGSYRNTISQSGKPSICHVIVTYVVRGGTCKIDLSLPVILYY